METGKPTALVAALVIVFVGAVGVLLWQHPSPRNVSARPVAPLPAPRPAASPPSPASQDTKRLDSPDSEARFTQAIQLVKAFKFPEARALLEAVIQTNPNHSEAHRWLGDCHYNTLAFDQAIAAYSRARALDPNNYLALRGLGFAHLHKGRSQYKAYKAHVTAKDKAQAGLTLQASHTSFQTALETLRQCLRLLPGDNEAMYGRAMAAEGTSRKLYSNAVVLKRKGKMAEAAAWAERCLETIDEGIDAGKIRMNDAPHDPNPRILVAGLFLRRACLLKAMGKSANAIIDLKQAIATCQSVLKDVDKGNVQAQGLLKDYQQRLTQWQAEGD